MDGVSVSGVSASASVPVTLQGIGVSAPSAAKSSSHQTDEMVAALMKIHGSAIALSPVAHDLVVDHHRYERHVGGVGRQRYASDYADLPDSGRRKHGDADAVADHHHPVSEAVEDRNLIA